MISVSIVHWFMGEEGWTFEEDEDGIVGDRLGDATRMYEIYLRANPEHTGRVTVPVLWDTKTQTIVSNESSEIIRMFNSAFDDIGAKPGDYYPEALREEIDEVNERIYHTLNNGVYKSGFATTQEAYEEAVNPLFDTLDWLEERLSTQRYLTGDTITEADWRLFPTLVRFDPVYVGHFKCDKRRIADYPNLSNYLRDLYQQPGIAGTINMEHSRKHYYASHESINPHRIVSIGPDQDLSAPHDRDRFSEPALEAAE
ncbi:glutathione S-transferase family protein [Erythrobacter rubeus]|uniref:glutathione S-transferase family protein n=1 Tax=Erythrobacter rubeus TaxID=2760803 RepID=UPI002E2E1A5B|nr:glutathione S-transferase family protein [Erythrobacter rubeus]